MQTEKIPTSPSDDFVDIFLKNAKKNLFNITEFDSVTVVMGNESGDLDSVCCSIAYGVYFYDHYLRNSIDCVSIALVDVEPDELPCKTEVLYWLKKIKVQACNVVCRNQIDMLQLQALGKLRLVLVDHHVLPRRYRALKPSVVEIIDHRPLQEGIEWPGVEFQVDITGSCASLLARRLMKMRKELFTLQFTLLLYGPIVLDTVGLSRTCGRTTDFDVKMAEILEAMYDDLNRESVLTELVSAKRDVSGLNTLMLLRKDVKFAGAIPICAFPHSIPTLVERMDIERALRAFCDRFRAELVIVMGQEVIADYFERTIGVFALEPALESGAKIIDYLAEYDDPDLELEIMEEESNQIPHLTVYIQGNSFASRKQVLPIVLEAIDAMPELRKYKEPCSC